MSREIKFRAWDKKNKIMTCSPINCINFDGQLLLNDGQYYDIEKTDYVLSQFTGLLDKNGKEIFEGDILSHRYYSKPVICEFVDGSLIFGDISKHDKSLEVIGNIYQNPELLGGEND